MNQVPPVTYLFYFRSGGGGGQGLYRDQICTLPSEYKTDKKWSHHYVTLFSN